MKTIVSIPNELGFCDFSATLTTLEQNNTKVKITFLECLTPKLEHYFKHWVKMCCEVNWKDGYPKTGFGYKKIIKISNDDKNNLELIGCFTENQSEINYLMPLELEFYIDKII